MTQNKIVVDFDDLEAEGGCSSEIDDIWKERTAGLFPVY